MAIRERMSGNEAVSYAIKQIEPDVMPAFPITPSTEIPEHVATYIANGEIETEFVPVESEHSSMSAAVGASAAGARTLTATSSCGLALMWEELYVAASNRLPIVLALVNRTLSGPININCDHTDSMGARDSGWIQIYAENNQEAYDNFVQAYRIAEHTDVRLPVMICQDGFITSHAVENIELLDETPVKEFVGDYQPENYLLHADKPLAVGPYSVSDYAMEARKNQELAMERSRQVILDVAAEFAAISGRNYGYFEGYCLDDAEYVILLIGSAAGTTKDAIDQLRAQGKKVGLLKVRVYRPFPEQEIAHALRHAKAVAILDRAESYRGGGGPLGMEVNAALFKYKIQTETRNYIYGLAGRDFTTTHVEAVFNELEAMITENCDVADYQYIGLRK
jgi:pyruvate ferredoxin oxidoreductase alpha subunit